MGIPGAFVLLMASPTTNLFFGRLAYEAWQASMGEGMWPLSIGVSLIWPLCLPVAYFFTSKLFSIEPFFSPKPLAGFVLILLPLVLVVGQAAIIATGKVHRLTREDRVATAVRVGNLGELKRDYLPSDLTTLKPDPLADAIFNRRAGLVEFLISQREDVNRYYSPDLQKSFQFATPLHTAVNVNSVEIAGMLLSKGADPNAVDSNGGTPLHTIGWHPDGNGEILLLLKKHRADFTRVDKEGNTPLISMTKRCLNLWDGIAKYAEIMIESGLDPKRKNSEGLTALDYAKKNYQTSLVNLLERK